MEGGKEKERKRKLCTTVAEKRAGEGASFRSYPEVDAGISNK